MKILAFIAVILVGALLLYATGDFPALGDPLSPANGSPVSRHYIQEVESETHVPNLVTAILADYRGYDTMFETVVIFVAGIAILAILRAVKDDDLEIPPSHRADPPHEGTDLITVMTAKLATPVIQLFALYVVAHGHHSPGGGFQGGVMLGASFILLALTCGLPSTLKRLPEKRGILLAGLGIFIYSGTGLVCLLLGVNFLDYHILSQILPSTDPIMARSHAMLIVETGVAFTVTSIMFMIYANLATGGKMKGGL